MPYVLDVHAESISEMAISFMNEMRTASMRWRRIS